MTTDRTALESARDALPPLPASDYVPDTDPAFTAQQMRDYASQAVTAALSSPPVLPAEPVHQVKFSSAGASGWTDIDAHAADLMRADGYIVRTLYAAPQEAAPALDDARALTDEQIIAAMESAGVKFQAFPHPHRDEMVRSTAGSQSLTRIIAGVRAAMQQEPRS